MKKMHSCPHCSYTTPKVRHWQSWWGTRAAATLLSAPCCAAQGRGAPGLSGGDPWVWEHDVKLHAPGSSLSLATASQCVHLVTEN